MLLKVAFIVFYIFIFVGVFVVVSLELLLLLTVSFDIRQSGNKPNRLKRKQAEVEWKTKEERCSEQVRCILHIFKYEMCETANNEQNLQVLILYVNIFYLFLFEPVVLASSLLLDCWMLVFGNMLIAISDTKTPPNDSRVRFVAHSLKSPLTHTLVHVQRSVSAYDPIAKTCT